jgi:phage-related protein
MKPKFTISYLEEAIEFLESLSIKAKEKVTNNISKAADYDDRELFKKLEDDIWEFRTLNQNLHIRLFAFWDKRNNENTLVVATHGIIKKKSKVDKREIDKAKRIRSKYFDNESS